MPNLTNPKQPNYGGPCPRCGQPVPNSAMAGQYPGALSRVDNETYICSDCGTSEAMFNFTRPGEPLPPVTEYVFA